jgi:hypothetical protein
MFRWRVAAALGAAVLLAAAAYAGTPLGAPNGGPTQVSPGDRSRGFYGFRDWDSNAGRFARTHRVTTDDEEERPQTAPSRTPAKKEAPPWRFGKARGPFAGKYGDTGRFGGRGFRDGPRGADKEEAKKGPPWAKGKKGGPPKFGGGSKKPGGFIAPWAYKDREGKGGPKAKGKSREAPPQWTGKKAGRGWSPMARGKGGRPAWMGLWRKAGPPHGLARHDPRQRRFGTSGPSMGAWRGHGRASSHQPSHARFGMMARHGFGGRGSFAPRRWCGFGGPGQYRGRPTSFRRHGGNAAVHRGWASGRSARFGPSVGSQWSKRGWHGHWRGGRHHRCHGGWVSSPRAPQGPHHWASFQGHGGWGRSSGRSTFAHRDGPGRGFSGWRPRPSFGRGRSDDR